MKRILVTGAMLLAWVGAVRPAATQEEPPVWQTLSPAASQPAAAGQNAGLPAEEIEKILAPIALYPDVLLAQMLPAATFPVQIVQAARWLRSGPDMSKLQDQPWDPSVLALCNYPDIIYKMDEDLDWTNALGTAFLEQQQDVMNTIQDLRRQAEASGALTSTDQQTVSTDQGAIAIAPAQPETIYIPQYDPQVVYVDEGVSTGTAVAASAISFGTGLALGAWLNTDCDWYHHNVVWCEPGHWHGYVYGGAAWGPNRIAAWGPNRALIAGPNGGAYFGPHGGAVWGDNGRGAAWARSTPYGRPSYTGRYASYNTKGNRYSQVNRGSINAGNTVNVNRNNLNLDRGYGTSISAANRANVSAGDRSNITAGNRAGLQAGQRSAGYGGSSSAFGGSSRPSQAQQYSQRGSLSRNLTPTGQPSRSYVSPQTGAGGGSARMSSFGDTGSRSQMQSFSSRGSASRGGFSSGGFGGAGRGGGFGGGGGRGRR